MLLLEKDKRDLTYSMRKSLLEQIKKNTSFFGNQLKNITEFVAHDATYEQLLNLCYNQDRVYDYKSADVLEQVAIKTILEHNKGVDQNVLFESKLVKKTTKK